MKNDTLGKLSSIHVALCDQKEGGPKHPEAKQVAAMISVQVDFAKHSDCISKKQFTTVQ